MEYSFCPRKIKNGINYPSVRVEFTAISDDEAIVEAKKRFNACDDITGYELWNDTTDERVELF